MFSCNFTNLPSLQSFQRCEEWAKKRRVKITKRTNAQWHDGCVPLRTNRDFHLRMEWIDDGEDSRWALMLYRTEVVGYFRDGRTLLNVTYGSNSTRAFFCSMTNCSITLRNTKYGYMYRINDEYHVVNRSELHPKFNQAVIVDVNNKVLNPQDWKLVKTVSNRERRKEIKQKLKPFLEWYDALTNMTKDLRGVLAGAVKFENLRPLVVIGSLKNAFAHSMSENELDLDLWKNALWELLANQVTWFPINDRLSRFGEEWVRRIRTNILNTAFHLYDGNKEITVVVPAGQRP